MTSFKSAMRLSQVTNRSCRREKEPSGFALIITVTMMILLSILAVGFLSLSTISLRGSQRDNASQMARSNARLALTLAIGDLQKKLGPDQRISAPASIVRSEAPQGVTGVWNAWSPEDNNKGDTSSKDQQFIGWLASDTLLGKDNLTTSTPYVSPDKIDAAILLGERSIEGRSSFKSDDQRVAANKLPVNSSNDQKGALAWVTFDESIKSRMNLSEPENVQRQVANIARAGSPPRDGVFAIDKLGDVKPDPETARRMISYETSLMATKTDELLAYRPDLSSWSMSLLTDPVHGGLKRDLSTLFANGMSSTQEKQGLYDQAGLITSPSDPPMSLLAGYHDLYKKIGVRGSSRVDPGAGAIAAEVSSSYRPYRNDPRSGGVRINRTAPSEPLLMPTVVRTDIIFSLVTRDVHGNRAASLRSSGYPYLLHLMYLPVVTLHNPYDVPLVFSSIKVNFKDIPIGFQFQVNGQPMTTKMVPLNNLYAAYQTSNQTKEFGITLKSESGSGSSNLRLEPGQTKLFGTPKVPPTWTWADEQPGAGADGVNLFDWRSDKTSNFNLSPTLITQSTTTACGFDVDWLQPTNIQTAAGRTRANGEGVIALRGTETIGVEFGPVAQASNSFSITTEIANGSGRTTASGAINVSYGNVDRLKEIVEEGTSLRYPEKRSFPATFPETDVDGTIRVRDIYEPNTRAVKDYVFAKPFAIFSLSGRTTLESFVPSRPFADSSVACNLADIDLSKGKESPGNQPYELVMMPIRNNTAVIEENRAEEEAYFFGGHGTLRGTSRATFYEIPRIPLQSLAQFRHANLGSSGFHPFTTYTVGESRAHPLIPSDAFQASNPSDNSQMLDHTWLANTALWDSNFLSTMADYTGELFGAGGRSAEDVRKSFFSGEDSLINSRLTPLNPLSEASDIVSLAASDEGWLEIAQYLALKGGFNVNSTSIDAWIATLSCLRDVELTTEDGVVSTGDYAALPRTRRPAGKSIDGQPLMIRENRWQGFRQLNDGQIEELAETIVEKIREQGPFLSLSEFVNRRLGPASDESSLRGVIEAAITESDVNQLMAPDGLELDSTNLGTHDYLSPEAAFGSNTAGAPGELSQGDVLSAIGSHLVVRGDTFVVRAYGESTDNSGKVLARAWCEGVVQRVPEFVDPSDTPETPIASLSETNQRFGRKFKLVSFRWLAPEEV